MLTNATRLASVYAAIDEANASDPAMVEIDGRLQPANVIYGRRMTTALDRFAPGASEPLRIATRGQHIERWIIPRDSFPMDRAGYLRWRRKLKDHHASRLDDIMTRIGYDAASIERVGDLVRKERLQTDSEVQTLEDVVCIVFLKYEIDAFAAKHRGEDAKLARILAKTWHKMSERGHEAVMGDPPDPAIVALLERGLKDAKISDQNHKSQT